METGKYKKKDVRKYPSFLVQKEIQGYIVEFLWKFRFMRNGDIFA